MADQVELILQVRPPESLHHVAVILVLGRFEEVRRLLLDHCLLQRRTKIECNWFGDIFAFVSGRVAFLVLWKLAVAFDL
ncbi:hypothetical protein Tco_1146609 [Tanacetum coccineum]